MKESPRQARRGPPATYWIVVIVVIVLGFVGFSIGPPITVLGFSFLLLGAVYPYPRVFWPLAILAFTGCVAFAIYWYFFFLKLLG